MTWFRETFQPPIHAINIGSEYTQISSQQLNAQRIHFKKTVDQVVTGIMKESVIVNLMKKIAGMLASRQNLSLHKTFFSEFARQLDELMGNVTGEIGSLELSLDGVDAFMAHHRSQVFVIEGSKRGGDEVVVINRVQVPDIRSADQTMTTFVTILYFCISLHKINYCRYQRHF